MKVIVMMIPLLLLCVEASVSEGHRRHLQHSSPLEDNNNDSDHDHDDDANNLDVVVTKVGAQPTRIITKLLEQPPLRAVMAYARTIVEAVIAGCRPRGVDFGSILRQGDAAEIGMALCHPSRLIQSSLLGWVTTEAWRQCGLFRVQRRPRRPRKRQEGKRYRRVTSTMKMYKREVKGVIESTMEDEHFQEQYASSRYEKQRGRAENLGGMFGSLVPESLEKGSHLTKTQKGDVLKRFEVTSPGRRHKPKMAGTKTIFGHIRITRKRKFTIASTLGYIVSPFLLRPMGSAIAGWMGVLCVSAELIPWVDAKFNLDVLGESEFLVWPIDAIRDNEVLKAVLLGAFVGGMTFVT